HSSGSRRRRPTGGLLENDLLVLLDIEQRQAAQYLGALAYAQIRQLAPGTSGFAVLGLYVASLERNLRYCVVQHLAAHEVRVVSGAVAADQRVALRPREHA